MANDLWNNMAQSANDTDYVSSIFKNKKENDDARRAILEAERYERQLAQVEQGRSPVVNPYLNIGVATQAAEMQLAEADQSLASALDTIRATGGGASSATMLARAAAEAKLGISANIEKQEVANQAKFAEGELKVAAIQEERDMAKMDRLASLGEGFRQREMDALAAEQAQKIANQQTAAQIGGAVIENWDSISELWA